MQGDVPAAVICLVLGDAFKAVGSLRSRVDDLGVGGFVRGGGRCPPAMCGARSSEENTEEGIPTQAVEGG